MAVEQPQLFRKLPKNKKQKQKTVFDFAYGIDSNELHCSVSVIDVEENQWSEVLISAVKTKNDNISNSHSLQALLIGQFIF